MTRSCFATKGLEQRKSRKSRTTTHAIHTTRRGSSAIYMHERPKITQEQYYSKGDAQSGDAICRAHLPKTSAQRASPASLYVCEMARTATVQPKLMCWLLLLVPLLINPLWMQLCFIIHDPSNMTMQAKRDNKRVDIAMHVCPFYSFQKKTSLGV